jgi:putative ABC transport system permease protein
MQRFINEFRGEPLLAVLPGVALDELWQTIGVLERTLLAISALVVLVGLERPRGHIAWPGSTSAAANWRSCAPSAPAPASCSLMLTCEGLLVTAAGSLLGLVLLTLGGSAMAPWLLETFGIVLGARHPDKR